MDEALKIGTEKLKNLHFKNNLKIRYLFRTYLVTPQAEITYLEGEKDVSKREKIIILHYLTAGKEIPITGKLIDFREVPSGNMYYSVFEARVCHPFLAHFGKNPSLFIKASRTLEGEKIDFGDIAFRFIILPGIPVNLILHIGDDEFPAACNVLFDSSVSDYLPTEDIAIVCEDLVMELIANSKT